MKNILICLMVTCGCITLYADKQLIETLYKDISGFNISAEESKNITDVGGAPTYGEITYDSLKTILDDLNITSRDVFYDLGSGVGKVAVQVYTDTPVKKSVGVELSQTRHQAALNVKKALQEKGYIKKRKTLEFYNKNIIDVPLSDATIVFMCSTCFSDDLMQKILNNLTKAKPGLHVLTLKQLPPHPNFVLEKTYNLPMTWSSSTAVYRYKKTS